MSLTVHARTKREGYVPPAHWEYIARMKSVVKLPILANGEIWTRADYERCISVCGIRDVALGRGLVGRPDLALQIKEGTPEKSWSDVRGQYFLPFFDKSFETRGEHFAVVRAKQLLKFLSRSYPQAAALFQTIKTLNSSAEMRRFFSEEEACQNIEFKFTPGPTAPTAYEQRIS
jgi:tRNA-dihydrouridine synthase C